MIVNEGFRYPNSKGGSLRLDSGTQKRVRDLAEESKRVFTLHLLFTELGVF